MRLATLTYLNQMTQALSKPVTIEKFAAWYPFNSERSYELHNGVVVQMPLPIGEHEEVVGFLVEEIVAEYRRLKLPYFIPKTVFVQTLKGESAYSPFVTS